jgi:hypothetical protein
MYCSMFYSRVEIKIFHGLSWLSIRMSLHERLREVRTLFSEVIPYWWPFEFSDCHKIFVRKLCMGPCHNHRLYFKDTCNASQGWSLWCLRSWLSELKVLWSLCYPTICKYFWDASNTRPGWLGAGVTMKTHDGNRNNRQQDATMSYHCPCMEDYVSCIEFCLMIWLVLT